MRLPANSPITLRFGATTSPYSPASPHLGTDFAYLPDSVIYAPFAGLVIQKPDNGNDGNGTYMYNGSDQFHGLLHASSYLVPNGATVIEGQPIAVMGATGFAQGVHCHWCVKQNGQFIDPMSLITIGKGADNMAAEGKPYNSGDWDNLAIVTGHSIDELKSKGDWNNVVYSILIPYMRELQAKTVADPDGEKWRNLKNLLNS